MTTTPDNRFKDILEFIFKAPESTIELYSSDRKRVQETRRVLIDNFVNLPVELLDAGFLSEAAMKSKSDELGLFVEHPGVTAGLFDKWVRQSVEMGLVDAMEALSESKRLRREHIVLLMDGAVDMIRRGPGSFKGNALAVQTTVKNLLENPVCPEHFLKKFAAACEGEGVIPDWIDESHSFRVAVAKNPACPEALVRALMDDNGEFDLPGDPNGYFQVFKSPVYKGSWEFYASWEVACAAWDSRAKVPDAVARFIVEGGEVNDFTRFDGEYVKKEAYRITQISKLTHAPEAVLRRCLSAAVSIRAASGYDGVTEDDAFYVLKNLIENPSTREWRKEIFEKGSTVFKSHKMLVKFHEVVAADPAADPDALSSLFRKWCVGSGTDRVVAAVIVNPAFDATRITPAQLDGLASRFPDHAAEISVRMEARSTGEFVAESEKSGASTGLKV